MVISKNLVSIIVPCYNQAHYLDEALQSVFEQTCANWECIIINDGSPDHTEELAKKWVTKDNRFIYLKKENGGLSSARNAGLEVAKGEYIQFLDSDDFLVNTKLELSLQQIDLEKNRGVKVAVSNFRMFVDNPQNSSAPYCNLKSHLFNFESVLYKWEESFTIPIHCGLFESSLLKSFRFPEEIKAKEDWVMWVSLFSKGCEAVFIDKPLALYRTNPESMTMTKDMLPDFLSAYQYFAGILTAEQFNKLSIVLLSRYYRSTFYYKTKLVAVWKSYTYRSGNFIKKLIKKIGILKFSRRVFKKMLQSKSISKYF